MIIVNEKQHPAEMFPNQLKLSATGELDNWYHADGYNTVHITAHIAACKLLW